MGRTVEDVARLLAVQAGENPEVPFGRGVEDYVAGLDRDMRGVKIGWLGDWGGAYAMEPGILDLCEAALRQFAELGAEVEGLPPPFPAEKRGHAGVTLRAMLNAGGFKAIYDDPAKRALLKLSLIHI